MDSHTGKLIVRPARSGGFFVRLESLNGETLLASEVYQGHGGPERTVDAIKRAMENPQLVIMVATESAYDPADLPTNPLASTTSDADSGADRPEPAGEATDAGEHGPGD